MPKNATLEIHQINAGQGDATLVLVRNLALLKAAAITGGMSQGEADRTDGIDFLPYCVKRGLALAGTVTTSLLIDGGNDCYGFSTRNYLLSVGALNPATVFQPNFAILATHYHDDHQDGLRGVMRDPPPLGSSKTEEKFRPSEFHRLADFPRRDTAMGTMPAIMGELADQIPTAAAPRTVVRYIPVGGKDESTLPASQYSITLGSIAGGAIPIVVKIVASERAVFAGAAQLVTAVPPKARAGKKKVTIDENDRSIAVVVECGSFRHFVAGDAGGKEGTAYADIESVLGAAMETTMPIAAAPNAAKFSAAGHCCTMKLNHHGTKFSNDASFLATLRPKMAVIPSGAKLYFHGHPTKETVDRLLAANWTARNGGTVANSVGQILATEIASKGKGKAFNPDPTKKIKIVGDMIIRPVDEDIVACHVAPTTGQAIRIQGYGNLEQTPMPAGGSCELRATEAAAPIANYPHQPVEVSCNLH